MARESRQRPVSARVTPAVLGSVCWSENGNPYTVRVPYGAGKGIRQDEPITRSPSSVQPSAAGPCASPEPISTPIRTSGPPVIRASRFVMPGASPTLSTAVAPRSVPRPSRRSTPESSSCEADTST
ncbi:hypothetical protein GCM10010411_59290 [Actinomadura fulvescens]|uniref:Uncharacterized protein n=2 Tax=Actinomadura fulvescens TaxID=46160 RepID=A0ABN3Q7K7_9ACTN